MRSSPFSIVSAALLLALLTACAGSETDPLRQQPRLTLRTEINQTLLELPPAQRKVVVAVYTFQDLTGQNKPNEKFAEYSRAVTQGGTAILVNALQDVGKRSWFTVLERNALNNLLQERQIIRQTREQYRGADGRPLPPIDPLLNAGILMEGGVVGYDSNTLTGGAGANLLGIGGDVQYRRDTVSVFLRAVSTRTGEILKSVSTTKTIYSVAVSGSVFKFIDFKKLLQAEAGFTSNEPPQLAIRQAIEKAVYAMVIEGAIEGYWTFGDREKGRAIINEYLEERDGEFAALLEPGANRQEGAARTTSR